MTFDICKTLLLRVERVTRIELVNSRWQRDRLPLHHTRIHLIIQFSWDLLNFLLRHEFHDCIQNRFCFQPKLFSIDKKL